MAESLELSASQEDYLEAILVLGEERKVARPRDIARHLGVSSPSVTGALRALARHGLIQYAPYEFPILTPKGEACARAVSRRHEALRDFFLNVLGASPEDSDHAACRMEHAMPRTMLARLSRFAEFLESCPRGGSSFREGFRYFFENRRIRGDCENCIRGCFEENRA